MGLWTDFANCVWSPTASSAWISKISDSHSVALPIEHNSFLSFCAQMRDWISNPVAVNAAMNNSAALAANVARTAGGGQWWMYSPYHGPAPSAGGAVPFTSVQGLPRAIFGAYPRPTQDATRQAWWQALAELEFEIGTGWAPITPATPMTSGYTDGQWAGIESETAQGIIPDALFSQIPGVYESNTVKTLLYDTATGQADLVTAVITYGLRLQTAVGNASAASAITPTEQAVAPLVQQLSQAYAARATKNSTLAAVAGGLLLGGAAIARAV